MTLTPALPIESQGRPTGDRLRRALDVLAAVTGLILAAPLMAATAIAVKIESPGPLLFGQMRVGRGGRPFRLYKFRKFHDGAGGRSVTLRGDSRMTRVGRVLERTKLDELPQLWNVLRGDMALVGPRPETLDHASLFTGPFHSVLDHRPGLFGPTQAMFRDEASMYPAGEDPSDFYRRVLFPAKARIDAAYYPGRTIARDIGWVLRGLLAVLGLGRPVPLILTTPAPDGEQPVRGGA